MVKTLVVVFKNGGAFCLAGVVLGVCVGRVAREDFLPEGEAAGWACRGCFVSLDVGGFWRESIGGRLGRDWGAAMGWRWEVSR